MKKSLRCICAAIFMLAFCTGFVIHASAGKPLSYKVFGHSVRK